jgi:hypothetical protein
MHIIRTLAGRMIRTAAERFVTQAATRESSHADHLLHHQRINATK